MGRAEASARPSFATILHRLAIVASLRMRGSRCSMLRMSSPGAPMMSSSNTRTATARSGFRTPFRRLRLLILARPRLVSNLLALVALFSIGFV